MSILSRSIGRGKGTSSVLGPRQLFQQILVMQGIYYAIGFTLILFTCIVSGDDFSLTMVFSWEPVRIDTTMGWTLFLLWLLDTIFSVIALTVVVGRSKLALDFTLTLHGIHFVVCWMVSGEFPKSKLWWGLQFVSVGLMVLLGTWTSQWRELRATFFETVPDSSISSTTAATGLGADSGDARNDPIGGDLGIYDEFELQPHEIPKRSKLSQSLGGEYTQGNNGDNDYDDDDDNEGDITAGSKLLRGSLRN